LLLSHPPTDQVDVVQMCVLEFENRPEGERFYHLENYIEGQYIKYNSNSGFVDANLRATPQVNLGRVAERASLIDRLFLNFLNFLLLVL